MVSLLELVPSDEASKSIPTNVRWMALKVLTTEKEDGRVTSVDDGKRADVYSFLSRCLRWVYPGFVPKFGFVPGPPRFPRQVLSGTSLFPNDSDEEVVGGVTTGWHQMHSCVTCGQLIERFRVGEPLRTRNLSGRQCMLQNVN